VGHISADTLWKLLSTDLKDNLEGEPDGLPMRKNERRRRRRRTRTDRCRTPRGEERRLHESALHGQTLLRHIGEDHSRGEEHRA
jgi:hypothetical protein